VELLRLSKAAKRLGVHPVTLRLWADSGKIPVTWVGRERRFSSIDVEAMKVSTSGGGRVRLEGLYVRVSGSTGQESSLEAQEYELRATSTGEIVKVFRDRALVTTFAGRLYGMRSAQNRCRLLAESGQCQAGGR
jgi:putative resolvase